MITENRIPFQKIQFLVSPPLRNAIIFLLCQAPLEILPTFENICEHYQSTSNGLSTVFVLITDHLKPFQNNIISWLSSSDNCDHFSFMSATLRRSSYFLKTCEYYQYSSDGRCTVFVLTTNHLMPFQNTLISRLSSAENYTIIFLICHPPLEILPIF